MAIEATTPTAQFQLRSIELHELAIHKIVSGLAITNFNFDINIDTNVDRDQRLVIAATKVGIRAQDKITELGKFTCACIFSIANFDEVVTMKENNVFELTSAFADSINSISISTTRGFMASELKGTILHQAFLPIIDVKSLAKKSV